MRTAWDNAFQVLEALDARRPGWSAYWAISELNPICTDMMTACGLQYRPDGEGLYVDVPFTPETTPVLGGIASFAHMLKSLDGGVVQKMQDIINGLK